MKRSLFNPKRWMPGAVILACMGFPQGAEVAGAPLFPNPAYATGSNPQGLAMGDLNGDGVQDIVAANHGGSDPHSGSLSLFYGRSDGTFAREIRYPTLVQPGDVFTVDLNKDGRPDLVLAGQTMPSILLNQGLGALGPEVLVRSAISFPILRLGDFDGDGRPDLFLMGLSSNLLAWQVLFGKGDGTFRAGPLSFPGELQDVNVADLDEDGKSDLIITTYDGSPTNELRVLASRGDGTFKPSFTLATGYYLSNILPADFNSDGHTDVGIGICTLIGSYCFGGPLLVAYGRGNGSLEPGPIEPTRTAIIGVATGDFNFDGRTDFVETSFDQDDLAVHLGLGDGTFAVQNALYVGESPYQVLCRDFDGNGTLDLAVLGHWAESVITLFGHGDGTFGPRQFPYYLNSTFNAAVATDINADGKLDLVMGEFSSQEVTVHLGNGDGTYNADLTFPSGNGPTGIAIADFNGDGNLDLAVAANEWQLRPPSPIPPGSLSIHLGDGHGGFRRGDVYQTGPDPFGVFRGDFNGDGVLDLIVLNGLGGYGVTPLASLFFGTGQGTFMPASPVNVGEFASNLTVGDFNGDGNADLAVSGRGHYSSTPPYSHVDGNVSIMAGNGNGTFGAAVFVASVYSASGVAAADLDDDGILDLAVSDEGGLIPEQRGGVKLFIGIGDGHFWTGAAYVAGVGPQAVRIADLDVNGIKDLALPNNGGDESVLLGRGGGAFLPEARFGLLGNLEFIADETWNGDSGIASKVPSPAARPPRKGPGTAMNPPGGGTARRPASQDP